MTVELLVIFAMLQAADIWTTWRLFFSGGRELNPVMSMFIAEFGLLPSLLVTKGAVLALVGYFAFLGALPAWLLAGFCLGYVIVVFRNWRQIHA